jgi:hypothetical protein
MSGSGDRSIHDTLSAEDAFRLFSHEIRIDILFALWDAPEFRLTFSQLKDEVDERDSGKFNYHLSKLVGQFVGHVGDEYELLYPGHRVIDAIRSGMLHQSAEIGTIELAAACPNCDCHLEFQYSANIGTVSCPQCDELVLEFAFDPGGVANRSPKEIIDAFEKRTRYIWSLALEGVCPICSGEIHVEPSLTAGKSPKIDHFGDTHPVVISLDCEQCSFYSYPPAGMVLLDDLEVVSMLSSQGVDLQGLSLWEIDFIIDPACISLQSTDPFEIEVTTAMEGIERRITLDEDLSIRKIERDGGENPQRE